MANFGSGVEFHVFLQSFRVVVSPQSFWDSRAFVSQPLFNSWHPRTGTIQQHAFGHTILARNIARMKRHFWQPQFSRASSNHSLAATVSLRLTWSATAGRISPLIFYYRMTWKSWWSNISKAMGRSESCQASGYASLPVQSSKTWHTVSLSPPLSLPLCLSCVSQGILCPCVSCHRIYLLHGYTHTLSLTLSLSFSCCLYYFAFCGVSFLKLRALPSEEPPRRIMLHAGIQ